MVELTHTKDGADPVTEAFSTTSLNPGLSVDVEIESQIKPQLRCRTSLVGWRKDKYLVLRPSDSQYHLFSSESYVILRYLVEGQIYAFKTRILATTANPERLIFCYYPQQVTNLRLRQHTRYATRLFAQLEVDNNSAEGLILDISASGCQFLPRSARPDDLSGSSVNVVFPFLRQGRDILKIPAVIRNQRLLDNGVGLGIQFTGSVEAVMKLLMLDTPASDVTTD
ncbi:flagellar brake protein [Ferrimonas balearica]|uniref:flagellar brake domain-containing protein n=1 Tax=Ferrimonas balearica TaxID=44012 RepID=UPI001C98FA6C|nr:flagellar brake protein [Ferrimonas balearica]MBY5921190.1 flagellar brake protein [Ferrimonas balearica]MBY5996125.1 flagellar brake protein [Ferrimonas balearica]